MPANTLSDGPLDEPYDPSEFPALSGSALWEENRTSGAGQTVRTIHAATIRFAGDSGDGMQLTGTQFSDTSALIGNDISTLPDYPAEIRAPAGTLAGVSGFQLQFSDSDIYTPGDEVDTLVAMNPAALRANVASVRASGIIIANEDAFSLVDLKKAGYATNPLENGLLSGYRLVRVPIDRLTSEALTNSGLTSKQIDRCKNFFTLGLVSWLYDRPLQPALHYIDVKFRKKLPALADANSTALKAGYLLGETAELFPVQFHVEKANLRPGRYRKITGNEAVALGLLAAGHLHGKDVFYGSYPITPASEILHNLVEMKHAGVTTFQAEDEIAAVTSAIGASFGGALGVTGTSGPGLALKAEAIGLAVMTELPLVVIDVQRGGPSTGLPTKTEQADLLQAVAGRNGECPVPVIAAASPADCFNAAIEAVTTAVRYMTPVILLTDGYIANSAEPWLIPNVADMPRIEVKHPTEPNDAKGFMPYARNADGARPWALPGTPGLEHRIGGLEKQDRTGEVTCDGANHQLMVNLRAAKVAGIQPAGASFLWTGPERGDVLIVGWGGTYGAIKQATVDLRKHGAAVSSCQIRYLNPLLPRLGELFERFKTILVAELNLGQLAMLLRARFGVRTVQFNKVAGQPFTVHEITEAAQPYLK
jgi:2-oxoglutarate/2-oxoacid ferredoxin oxidoreductase subunit alpha